MNGLYDNKIFNMILLITIIGEFLLPWILKHFYSGYNSKTMVMSALGSPESPVKMIYRAWLVWLGILLICTSFVMFSEVRRTSISIAVIMLVVIDIFAIGAGILSGIFSVNESKEVVTFASKIHGIGAAIGFMALLFLPLLDCIVAFKNNNYLQGGVCLISFLLAVTFFVFFIMGDKEELKKTIFAYEGLWERLALFFMYVPFLYRALESLIMRN